MFCKRFHSSLLLLLFLAAVHITSATDYYTTLTIGRLALFCLTPPQTLADVSVRKLRNVPNGVNGSLPNIELLRGI